MFFRDPVHPTPMGRQPVRRKARRRAPARDRHADPARALRRTTAAPERETARRSVTARRGPRPPSLRRLQDILDALEEGVAALDDALERGAGKPELEAQRLKVRLWAYRRRLVRLRRHARGDVGAELNRLIGAVDRSRAFVNAAVEAYFARQSARTNAVVKTLSLATAVLMPLSLIAALYGMNFRHLPGRDHPLGFWAVTLAMVLVAGGLLVWFRRRRWW